MKHSKIIHPLFKISFKNALSFLFLLFVITSCNNCDCPENKNKPPEAPKKEDNRVTATQLIFTDVDRCLMTSDKTEMIWYSTHPVVMDKEINGKSSAKKAMDNGIKIHGHLTKPKDIYAFIDSLPDLSEMPTEISSVRVSSYSYLIFVCNKDTLVSFSWDPGREQLNVNNRWWFKFDFDKLYKQLDKIKTNEK
jgi:hypothetical protein